MTLNKKKLKRYKKLKQLIKKWTICEVMSRIGECKGMSFGDYYTKKLDLQDTIRKYLFGTSDLIELGKKFNLPIIDHRKKKK